MSDNIDIESVSVGDHFKRQPEAEPKIRKTRFQICKECENLQADKCKICGCWVPLMARMPFGRCPIKKW